MTYYIDKYRRWLLGLVFTLGLAHAARAQLAITEVMSAAFGGPDYWELTNFGTNEVNLEGYSFQDSNPEHPLVRDPFTNLVLRAGESMVFFQAIAPVGNLAQFRSWWGESTLPPALQGRSWPAELPRLSGWDGDAVWLFDPAGIVVDGVRFGRARQGKAFTYDAQTGLFGALSSPGEDGAFSAETANDTGSPGATTGPVPARIFREPLDEAADMGATVLLAVAAGGMPNPKFQWVFNGQLLDRETSPTLVLSNVQPANAGAYQARLTNGLSAVTSRVAILTVNTSPRAPVVESPPQDATVFPGQTAVFTVSARGLPAPSYQWECNGVAVAGARGPTLEIPNAPQELSGAKYSVRIWNSIGVTNLSAALTVTRRPDLRFTEIMALPAQAEQRRHFDWFELTNFDTNAVHLQGWRFADEPELARALTITNALTLQPGESAIFAARLDARLFAAWWGAENLPDQLQVFTFSGFALQDMGEVLCLWNPAATDSLDTVAVALWAAAVPGVSFECERMCDAQGLNCLDDAASESAPGVRGAFWASGGNDLGSPGYVTNPPLRLLSVQRRAGGELELRCRVAAGKTYRLWRAASLLPAAWTAVDVQTATGNLLTFLDVPGDGEPTRFYRVEEVP